ncbi:MAG TPA: hypothetical protein VGP72_22105 [Planctomycetota bacterium]|jgi:hypothetical protein
MNTLLEGLDAKRRAIFATRKLHADPGELLYPRQAAVEMLNEFRSIARQLAPKDRSTQDDLVQEMAMAALLLRQPQTRSTFRFIAAWHAQNYLVWWYRPMRKSKQKDDFAEEPEPTSLELDRCAEAINVLAAS